MKGGIFTMTEKKMTYKVALTNAMAQVSDEETRERLADLLAREEKKSASKSRVDNSEWAEKIEKVLKVEGAMTPSALMAKVSAPNTQKVTAVVKDMTTVKVNKVGKKVTYEYVG